jgi:hypothetical protein
MGDSEQALEYFSNANAANPRNIYNLSTEHGPSSFDIKLLNVTSVVYDLRSEKDASAGATRTLLPARSSVGWQINGINAANSGPGQGDRAPERLPHGHQPKQRLRCCRRILPSALSRRHRFPRTQSANSSTF